MEDSPEEIRGALPMVLLPAPTPKGKPPRHERHLTNVIWGITTLICGGAIGILALIFFLEAGREFRRSHSGYLMYATVSMLLFLLSSIFVRSVWMHFFVRKSGDQAGRQFASAWHRWRRR